MDTAPRVSLFVLLDGPAAAGLRDYARAEEIPVAVAADIYLGQVAARAAAAGIEVISTWPSIGPAAGALRFAASAADATAIAVPATGNLVQVFGLEQLARASGIAVYLIPPRVAAAVA